MNNPGPIDNSALLCGKSKLINLFSLDCKTDPQLFMLTETTI